jgi:hypothetical protein
MKRKISSYCVGLLVLINCFGLYQANKLNKNPFANETNNLSFNEKLDNKSNRQKSFDSNNFKFYKMLSENNNR